MSKRLIATVFAALVTLGFATAPAQAAPASSDISQPLGWEWGI